MLPVLQVTRPANLVNATNGRLGADLLVDVKFPGRGTAKVHFQTARCWWALSSDCNKATGATLTITSLGDAYRTFEMQLRGFLSRYTPVSYAAYLATPSARRRVFAYNGHKYWRLRDGMAPMATPGTSNHGWALALDVAILRADGAVVSITSNSKVWEWVKANAVRYGFSWELQSEPWHLRQYVGDRIPDAVKNYETTGISQVPIFDPAMGFYGLWPLATKPRVGLGSQGDVVKYLQGVILHKAGGNISVDGNYGDSTQRRVMDLQRFFGLTVDGWVGSETWKVIDTLASSK